MKPRIPEGNWHQARGRVSQGWSQNHWIISHRLGPQGQQTQDAGWAMASVDAPYGSRLPATAAARVGPARRQRAAESDWENEGGATPTPTPTPTPALAPGHSKTDE